MNRSQRNWDSKKVKSEAPGVGHNSQHYDGATLTAEEIQALEESWREATLPTRIALAYLERKAPRVAPSEIDDRIQKIVQANANLRVLVGMALFDDRIDLRPILVTAITAFSGNKYWRCSVSAARLGTLLGRSERTIRRYLTELVSEGWIVKTEVPGFSPCYEIALTLLDVEQAADPVAILDALAPKIDKRLRSETSDTLRVQGPAENPQTDCGNPGHSVCPESGDNPGHPACPTLHCNPGHKHEEPRTPVCPYNTDSNTESAREAALPLGLQRMDAALLRTIPPARLGADATEVWRSELQRLARASDADTLDSVLNDVWKKRREWLSPAQFEADLDKAARKLGRTTASTSPATPSRPPRDAPEADILAFIMLDPKESALLAQYGAEATIKAFRGAGR